MKVRELIEHLQKLNPEAEILPMWEQHCPGDFGGFLRGDEDDREDRPEGVIFLDCEGYPGDGATWDLPVTEPKP